MIIEITGRTKDHRVVMYGGGGRKYIFMLFGSDFPL